MLEPLHANTRLDIPWRKNTLERLLLHWSDYVLPWSVFDFHRRVFLFLIFICLFLNFAYQDLGVLFDDLTSTHYTQLCHEKVVDQKK